MVFAVSGVIYIAKFLIGYKKIEQIVHIIVFYNNVFLKM